VDKQPDTIEISVWVKRGKMLVRRSALDIDDPDHPYNYIKAKGLRPEDYGIDPPPMRDWLSMVGEMLEARER
jgi:hypothetical protein